MRLQVPQKIHIHSTPLASPQTREKAGMRSGLTTAAQQAPSILFSRCIPWSRQNKELQAALGFPLHKGGECIPFQVSHSPGGSSDLLPQSPSGSHQNPAAMRRHRGVVAQFCPNKRLCHIFPPLPSLASPHTVYQIRGLERRGKGMQKGFHRSEPLVPGPAKWEAGQHFFCRFLQDTPGQLCRQ